MPSEDHAKQYFKNEWNLGKKTTLLNVVELSLQAGCMGFLQYSVTIGCGGKVVRTLTLKFSKAPEGLTN